MTSGRSIRRTAAGINGSDATTEAELLIATASTGPKTNAKTGTRTKPTPKPANP